MPVGTVKWFDPTRATASSSLSPVTTCSSHVSAIQEGGWLEEGQAVEFDIIQGRIIQGRKGPQAANVRPVATQ
jgi:cold shock CspA family protein